MAINVTDSQLAAWRQMADAELDSTQQALIVAKLREILHESVDTGLSGIALGAISGEIAAVESDLTKTRKREGL